jgi:hypothetical protein
MTTMVKIFDVKPALESDNTSKAHKYAEKRGWFTFKVESPTFNGLPDRCYIRRGRVVWIEWKRPGRGESGLSAIQVRRIKEMREHGAEVHVLDDLDEFKELMK